MEKNSKSQDMKIYTAIKFSIVIVPPTLSEKTKESKSLARSFRHIYKVAGFGIATGVSGLLSLSQMPRDKQIPDSVQTSRELSPSAESVFMSDSSMSVSDEPASFKSVPVLESEMDGVGYEVLKPEVLKPEVLKPEVLKPEVLKPEVLKPEVLESVDHVSSSDTLILSASEMYLQLAILSVILGGLTIYYLYRFLKKTK